MGRIIVTRPEGQQHELMAELQAAELPVVHVPLLSIYPQPVPPLATDKADIFIFISPNAATFAYQQLSTEQWQTLNDKTLIAVGSATQTKLTALQLNNISIPNHANSEGLLAMKLLQHVQNKRIILVCGVGGRQLLQQQLSERGAEVTRYEVYQRNPITPELLVSYQQTLESNDHWLLTSQDAIDALCQVPWAQAPRAIVSSQRLKDYAEDKGIHIDAVSTSALSSDLIQCVVRMSRQ